MKTASLVFNVVVASSMVLLKSQNIQSQIAVVDNDHLTTNVLGSNPIRDTRIWRSPEADG